MFVDHRNLYDTARIITEAHGQEAEAFVMKVIEDLSLQDNLKVIAVWEGILKAVQELQRHTGQSFQ